MLHLLGETTALLKQAGVFSLGSSETRFCRRRSWHCCVQGVRLAKGLLVGSWPSNTRIIQEQGSGEQEVVVYQGALSQPWCYWESLLCWSLLTGFRGKSWENERLQLKLGR